MSPARPLLLLVLGLAACGTTPPIQAPDLTLGDPQLAPPVGTACTKDDDCVLTSDGRDCCDGCTVYAASRDGLAALNAWCSDRAHPECPQLDCPDQPATPRCIGRICVAEPTKR